MSNILGGIVHGAENLLGGVGHVASSLFGHWLPRGVMPRDRVRVQRAKGDSRRTGRGPRVSAPVRRETTGLGDYPSPVVKTRQRPTPRDRGRL
jgi:hypothetical protein